MEAIGGSFFLIVLGIGLILLLKGKRYLGIIVTVTALFFLYLVPYLGFIKFKRDTYGKYRSDKGKILTIYKDATYSIYQNDNLIDSSDVEFSRNGDMDIYFMGSTQLEMNRSNGGFENANDNQDKYIRIDS